MKIENEQNNGENGREKSDIVCGNFEEEYSCGKGIVKHN